MNLRRVVLVSALASLIPLLASTTRAAAGPASTWCATGDPKSVLACLTAAYHARDIDAYGKLLAPDFRFSMAEGKVSWGRDEDIKSTRLSVFESRNISSVDLTFNEDVKVSPGPKPDTWTLDGVDATIHVVKAPGVDLAGDFTATAKNTFIVQLLNDPEPHYVILEWADITPQEH